ncbi:MAG: aldehyde dehydrogenase family protein [Opitutales bacterium]|nr:aldehyde dehydrogenase family protein [Opitutales bacterium]
MTAKASDAELSAGVFTSVDPALGKIIDNPPAKSIEAGIEQLKRSAVAQRQWARLSVGERCTRIRPLADKLREQASLLGMLITREMGKPIQQSLDEIEKSARTIEFYTENAKQFLQPNAIPTEAPSSYCCYKPLGVILGVLPWNFPVWQTIRACIPALLAGNAFAYKHAPNVQLCAATMGDVFAGIEDFQQLCVHLPVQNEAVPELIKSPLIAGVTFTGSSNVGSKIAAWAGASIKPCVLELGGSDPYIVLEDADLDLAASTMARARLHNNGQSCIGAKRMIVLESVAEAFTGRFRDALAAYRPENPSKPNCKLGPIARSDLRDSLHRQVVKSIEMGAQCLLGGEIPQGDGFFYPATLLLNPSADSPAASEELFGPVASLFIAGSEAEAIAIANASDYGLGAAIFSKDRDRAERLIRDEIQAGFGSVNGQVKSDPRLPFGGIGKSGFGRELGAEGIRAFTNLKTIVVN